MHRKVNRFTFDAHSVVLFSALVLTSAVSAATPSTLSRTQLTPVTTNSVNVRVNQPAVAQKTLTRTAASAQNSRNADRQRD